MKRYTYVDKFLHIVSEIHGIPLGQPIWQDKHNFQDHQMEKDMCLSLPIQPMKVLSSQLISISAHNHATVEKRDSYNSKEA